MLARLYHCLLATTTKINFCSWFLKSWSSSKRSPTSSHIKINDLRPICLTKSPFIYRGPAYLSASGTGCPLLCRDQIPKVWWGPPGMDHRDCRERKPHCSHHWQTTDHRGGTTSCHPECQPNSWCNFLILFTCIIDRNLKALLSDFRHINYKTILECWNAVYTQNSMYTEKTGLACTHKNNSPTQWPGRHIITQWTQPTVCPW